MRTVSILAFMATLILFAGCGPDGKALVASAQASISASKTAVAAGDLATARARWADGDAVFAANTAVMLDGQSLGAHRAAARADMVGFLDGQLPHLREVAVTSRSMLLDCQLLLETCGSDAQAAAWRDTDKPTLTKRIDDQEAEDKAVAIAAAAKAEHEREIRLSTSYLLWVEPAIRAGDRDEIQFRKQLVEAFSAALAPLPVEVVDARPKRAVGAGTIRVRLLWEATSYGSGSMASMGIGDAGSIPTRLDATATVVSRHRPTNLDGAHAWTAAHEAPTKVNQFEISTQAEGNRRLLRKAIVAQATALDKLADADAVAQAIATANAVAAAASGAVWTYAFSSTTDGDKDQGSWNSYAYCGPDIIDAIGQRLSGASLVDAAEKPPSPVGHIELRLRVSEASFGTSTRTMKTLNGTLPEAMTLTVAVKPAAGATTWPAIKIFSAELAAPAEVSKNAMMAAIRRQADAMIEQLVEKIAAEPGITSTP